MRNKSNFDFGVVFLHRFHQLRSITATASPLSLLSLSLVVVLALSRKIGFSRSSLNFSVFALLRSHHNLAYTLFVSSTSLLPLPLPSLSPRRRQVRTAR